MHRLVAREKCMVLVLEWVVDIMNLKNNATPLHQEVLTDNMSNCWRCEVEYKRQLKEFPMAIVKTA